MNKNQPRIATVLVAAVVIVFAVVSKPYAEAVRLAKQSGEVNEDVKQTSSGTDQMVARTRRQIQMLDDLYKTAIVLVTQHYVNDPSTLSAATASKAIFAEMDKRDWHETRLVGFTDSLTNPKNKPKDDFENAAKEKLIAGEAYHEEIVTQGGKDHLRMATPVPVVMEKCVMCHAGFKDEKGAIGALVYKMPLIE